MPSAAIRYMSVLVPVGSPPRSTGSTSSMVAKSAKRGTATSVSSSAVRFTSRVVPIRVLAS